jgi:hypothetical protein
MTPPLCSSHSVKTPEHESQAGRAGSRAHTKKRTRRRVQNRGPIGAQEFCLDDYEFVNGIGRGYDSCIFGPSGAFVSEPAYSSLVPFAD